MISRVSSTRARVRGRIAGRKICQPGAPLRAQARGATQTSRREVWSRCLYERGRKVLLLDRKKRARARDWTAPSVFRWLPCPPARAGASLRKICRRSRPHLPPCARGREGGRMAVDLRFGVSPTRTRAGGNSSAWEELGFRVSHARGRDCFWPGSRRCCQCSRQATITVASRSGGRKGARSGGIIPLPARFCAGRSAPDPADRGKGGGAGHPAPAIDPG